MLERRVRHQVDVNARERVRLAIKKRLGQLGMTQRAFGRAFSANDGKGHLDTWVSGLLADDANYGLSLDELDEAAKILKTTSAELVRSPFDYSEYLTPTERRIVQALRDLPPAIRDHFLGLAEYVVGVAPDEIDHVLEFRQLTTDEKLKVQHWTHALLMQREPLPDLPVRLDESAKDGPPADTAPQDQKGRRKR